MELSDSWVQRLSQAGDEQSQAIDALREILIRRLHLALRNQANADNAFIEDVVQDALLKILNSLEQFEHRAKFETWATTIAVRTAFTELRRKKWQDISLDSLVASHGEPDAVLVSSDENRSSRNELVQAMHIAIQNRLTKKQRIALLAELEGMPMEEIGRRTASNRNAVYKLTHDARKRLRKELESAGFSESDFFSTEDTRR